VSQAFVSCILLCVRPLALDHIASPFFSCSSPTQRMHSEQQPSPSKLRRCREAATKKRLYDSLHSNDVSAAILSQLCMLTSSIDSFMVYVNNYHNMQHASVCFDKFGNLIEGWASTCSEGEEKNKVDAKRNDSSAELLRMPTQRSMKRYCFEMSSQAVNLHTWSGCWEAIGDNAVHPAIDNIDHDSVTSAREKCDASPTSSEPTLDAVDGGFGSSCELRGGPISLHTEAIYTKTEMSTICEALVAPLAREIHALDDLEYLESMASADVPVNISSSAECTLGGLLHDVCSKVVPLTSALQAKRQAAHRVVDSIRARRHSSGDMWTQQRNTGSSTERAMGSEDLHKCPK